MKRLRTGNFAWLVFVVAIGVVMTDRAIGEVHFGPDLTLGASDEEYFFGSVLSVVEDTQGRIFIADRDQECVFRFDRLGGAMAKLGQRGEGPGDLMRYFVLGAGLAGSLYVAGSGGRVEVVDADWTPLVTFRRENPGGYASSIALFEDGGFAVSSFNSITFTQIDIYDRDAELKASVCEATGKGRSDDPRVANVFGGGLLAVDKDGSIFFLQKAPYLLQKFNMAGDFLKSTGAGGEDFVPEPPAPAFEGDSVSFGSFPTATGIAVSGNRFVVTSSQRGTGGDDFESMICVYNRDLVFLGTEIIEGRKRVVGGSDFPHVFFVAQTENGVEVSRETVSEGP